MNPEHPDQRTREVARALVELAAGVLDADAVSLWWHDQDTAYAIARFPATARQHALSFADMPDVGESILSHDTRVYRREHAQRISSEGAGIAVCLRLPVELEEVTNHFLNVCWETERDPVEDGLLPVAQRMADHITLTLSHVIARDVTRISALELSDNVVQALSVAHLALEMDDTETARDAIERASDHAHRILHRLLDTDTTSSLRRMYAAGGTSIDLPDGAVDPT